MFLFVCEIPFALELCERREKRETVKLETVVFSVIYFVIFAGLNRLEGVLMARKRKLSCIIQ